jgi:hypothetical protein
MLVASVPGDEFLQQHVVKSRDDLMGDRVDRLLQWKRKQEPVPNIEENGDLAENLSDGPDSEDERALPDDEDDDAYDGQVHDEGENEKERLLQGKIIGLHLFECAHNMLDGRNSRRITEETQPW